MTNKEAVLVLSIDRDYLYKNDNPKNKKAYDMAIELLTDPDVVKVVRCKDCDRSFHDMLVVNGILTEETWTCMNTKVKVDPKGFCNNGR